MSQELFYTSAPAGLKPGSKGFCTVVMTAGMSGILVQRLEMLSGYRELYPPGDDRAEQNPVAWSHWRLSVGERTASLLSRVCFAGMDYTHRANTFAHHIVIDASEQSVGGPAWVMSQPGVMESAWDGLPHLLPRGRQIPIGEDTSRVCSAWESVAGDAGWAGVLAQTAVSDTSNIAYIIYVPGTDVLSLIREAMTLLPLRQRWLTTFCTYFTELPAGLTCTWRCCVVGTSAAKEAHKYATSGVIIDLAEREKLTENSQLVRVARTGESLSPIREIVPAAAPELDWRGEDSERVVPSVGDQRFKSLQTLHELSGNDRGRMPPIHRSISAPDDDEALVQIVNSSRPRTIFWLVAILWPLLLIPGMIMWHLMSESQARRDLEMRVMTLNAKIQSGAHSLLATKQAANDNLAATIKRYNERISNLSATTQIASADLEETERQLQDKKKRYDTSMASKDAEIEGVKTQDHGDYAKALNAAKQDAEQKMNKLKDSIALLKQENGDLNGQLVAATTQPTFFWSGALLSAEPKMYLSAPEDGNYQCHTVSSTKIEISALNGSKIASVLLQDGQLKFEPLDTTAVKTPQFRNWLQLASIGVYNGESWTEFQLCSLSVFIDDLRESRNLPDYIKSADPSHIAWRRGPHCDSNWQLETDGNEVNCAFRGIVITLTCKDGVLSRLDVLPKDPARNPPPLVVDLLYEYDTKRTGKLLCRVKITSLLEEQ